MSRTHLTMNTVIYKKVGLGEWTSQQINYNSLGETQYFHLQHPLCNFIVFHVSSTEVMKINPFFSLYSRKLFKYSFKDDLFDSSKFIEGYTQVQKLNRLKYNFCGLRLNSQCLLECRWTNSSSGWFNFLVTINIYVIKWEKQCLIKRTFKHVTLLGRFWSLSLVFAVFRF